MQLVDQALTNLIWASKRLGQVIGYGTLGVNAGAISLPLGACFLLGLKVLTGFRVFDFTGNPRLGLSATLDDVAALCGMSL